MNTFSLVKDKNKKNVMSISKFIKYYGTEAQCWEHLFTVRFCENSQFSCPKCGGTSFYFMKNRHLAQCTTCKYQVSPMVGTIMEKSKVSLQNWFYTIYIMTIGKRGISAMELQYHLGVTYKTAWYLLLRIRTAMAAANDKYILEGSVVMDEAFFTGKSALKEGEKLKRGRGTNRTKVLIAVSGTSDGIPQYVRMKIMPNFRAKTIEGFCIQYIKKGSTLITDGFRAYQSQKVTKEYFHEFEVLDSGDKNSKLKQMHHVISNAKAFILGTFHGLANIELQSYLDEYSYRFNRRNMKHLMFDKLLASILATPPVSYYGSED